MDALTCAHGVGARKIGWKWVGRRTGGHERVDARTCADGVGARERLEMGGEKDRWA